jgi:hypothetical protein
MLRFVAKQVSPPPSDVWRFASGGATQATVSENILARIPGEYVADALQTLPNAATATEEFMQAFVHVPRIGRVRITAKRSKHTRGRSTHYFWTAESAVVEHEVR